MAKKAFQKTKSKNKTSYKKNTRKNLSKKAFENKTKMHLVKVFLELLNMVKLYHWKTHSFAEHKATDELYSKLNEHIDTFIEVLLGKDQSRVHMLESRIDLLDFNKKKDFQERILEYRTFLTELNMYFDSSRDSDLLTIRDEILVDINQFLYLLTFDK
jgi:DNA-binding ferritin-like protein